MVQKANRLPSAIDRLMELQIQSTLLFALGRIRVVPRTIEAPFGGAAPVGGSVGGSTNFLPTAGGAMIGNIGFHPSLIFALGGRVKLAPTSEDPKNSSNILVTGQGTPDDIFFIDGAERDGQFLIYQGTNTQQQILKNGLVLVITNIVGTVSSNTVTVTIGTGTTGLSNGDLVDIGDTVGFNQQSVTVADLMATTFTYDAGEQKPTVAETAGIVQTGNIFPFDGNDVLLDGTLSSTGAPIAILKFDTFLAGFGGWRVITSSSGGGSVSFPIRPPVTTGLATTGLVTLNLNQTTGHYFTIGPLTGNINITISNPPAANIAQAFRINIIKGGTDFTVTFNDTLLVTPTIGGANSTTLLAGDVYDGGAVYNIFSMNQGGGGGLTEPIILTPNIVTVNTLPTKSTINWNKNPIIVNLDRAVEFEFSNLPTSGKYEGVLVIIDIGGTVGFASPIWPPSLSNPPIIPIVADTRVSVMLYTIDGGTIVTHATSVGSGTGSITNQISQLDSSITITDTGSNGNAITLIDGVQKYSIQSTRADFAVPIFGLTDLNFVNGTSSAKISQGTTKVTWDLAEDADTFEMSFDSDVAFLVNVLKTQVHSTTPNVSAALLSLFRFDPSPVDTEITGQIDFDGRNDNSQTLTYASIKTVMDDVSDTTEDGSLRFSLQIAGAGTLSEVFAMKGTELLASKPLNMNTANKILNLAPPTADLDAATKKYVDDSTGVQNQIAQGDTSITITDTGSNGNAITLIDGVQRYSIQATRADFAVADIFGLKVLNFDGTLGASTISPSATGVIWNFPDDNDIFEINLGSTEVFSIDKLRTRVHADLPNTGSATLSLFRDDPSPTALDVVGNIVFEGKNSLAATVDYGEFGIGISDPLSTNVTGFYFLNVPIGGIETQILRVENGAMRLRQISTVVANSSVLTLEKDNTSPGVGESIGKIDFQNNDGGVIVKYATIQTLISNVTNGGLWKVQVRSDDVVSDALIIEGNDNSTQFQFLTSSNGNTRIQPASSTVIGYFVTPQLNNFTQNLGTSGTLEIPRLANNSPSLTDLNQAFGAFDGAFGYESVDERLYVRESGTRWVFFNASGAVT